MQPTSNLAAPFVRKKACARWHKAGRNLLYLCLALCLCQCTTAIKCSQRLWGWKVLLPVLVLTISSSTRVCYWLLAAYCQCQQHTASCSTPTGQTSHHFQTSKSNGACSQLPLCPGLETVMPGALQVTMAQQYAGLAIPATLKNRSNGYINVCQHKKLYILYSTKKCCVRLYNLFDSIIMCCIICYIPNDIIIIRYITQKTLYDIKKVYMMYNLNFETFSTQCVFSTFKELCIWDYFLLQKAMHLRLFLVAQSPLPHQPLSLHFL